MYSAFDWSICSGPSWISARVRSHYRTGLDWTIWVTSARMRRENRTSISTFPLADLGRKLLIGLCHRLLLIPRSSFVRAKGRSSRPAERRSRRAQGQSRPAVVLGLRRARALPGCALTAPSTARGSSGSDACIVSPRQLEGASFIAGALIGYHIAVLLALGGGIVTSVLAAALGAAVVLFAWRMAK